jgi:coenzyme F420-reducing hydrogenase delta subunit
VLACDYGGAAGREEGTVHMPCVAMAPPSLIDYVLSRDLADGVVVAGCAKSACFNRLGGDWTEQRFAGTRDPYLRARVPRERVATVWTSALAIRQAETEIAEFTERVAKLPSLNRRSLSPSETSAAAPQASTRQLENADTGHD